jgi:hypothetical protein
MSNLEKHPNDRKKERKILITYDELLDKVSYLENKVKQLVILTDIILEKNGRIK